MVICIWGFVLGITVQKCGKWFKRATRVRENIKGRSYGESWLLFLIVYLLSIPFNILKVSPSDVQKTEATTDILSKILQMHSYMLKHHINTKLLIYLNQYQFIFLQTFLLSPLGSHPGSRQTLSSPAKVSQWEKFLETMTVTLVSHSALAFYGQV